MAMFFFFIKNFLFLFIVNFKKCTESVTNIQYKIQKYIRKPSSSVLFHDWNIWDEARHAMVKSTLQVY